MRIENMWTVNMRTERHKNGKTYGRKNQLLMGLVFPFYI